VLDYPEFHKAWSDWQQHRREIKKKLTPTSAKSQLANLTKEAEQGNDPVAIIRNSIAGGYQGLFAPKGETKPNIPDPDELEAYVRSRYPDRPDGTNPEARYGLEFYRKYTAQGWYLGNKMPIVNWRAAVVQWIEKAMKETA
jgi:hypothetical protein